MAIDQQQSVHVQDKAVRWTRPALLELPMQRLFFHLQCLVIGCALLECSVAAHADSCVVFHKRAPMTAVCGRVINIAGEKLNQVDLTLTGETGSVLFTTRSDSKGFFSFGSIPKGDYTLHAKVTGYHVAEREI
jgi:hypothetical protein